MRIYCQFQPYSMIFNFVALSALFFSQFALSNNQFSDRLSTYENDSATPSVNNMNNTTLANNQISPFEISITDADIIDLKMRLDNTRIPDQLNNIAWEYGTDLSLMNDLLAYWKDEFDWRAQEEMLNQFDQFTTEVESLKLHFIHQRSSNPDAIPLMIVHALNSFSPAVK